MNGSGRLLLHCTSRRLNFARLTIDPGLMVEVDTKSSYFLVIIMQHRWSHDVPSFSQVLVLLGAVSQAIHWRTCQAGGAAAGLNLHKGDLGYTLSITPHANGRWMNAWPQFWGWKMKTRHLGSKPIVLPRALSVYLSQMEMSSVVDVFSFLIYAHQGEWCRWLATPANFSLFDLEGSGLAHQQDWLGP